MSRHAKSSKIIETARDILDAHHPMTVRQVYYQLVSRQSHKKQPDAVPGGQ